MGGFWVGKEMVTTGLGVDLGMEGGTNRVGVAVGLQAAMKNKNAQYEIRFAYFVLRSMDAKMLFVPTASITADIDG
jgi:hypothetical protein